MSEILRSIFSSPNWLPQGLSKNVFYAEISNLAARRRAPSNEALATHIKVSCICRFILVISVFTFLMWNFNTLGWLQILNLSLLFFWLSHYNGIVFDGIHATWKTEFASQLIISVSSIIALYNHEPIQFLITIIFSAISLTSYALYRYQQNKSRADNLVQALAE